MNQLISKSTGEDINTNLLAVISTRESNTTLAPLNRITVKGKGAVHLTGSYFTNKAIADKHFKLQGLCLGIVLQSCRLCSTAALRHGSSTMVCNIG